MSGARPHPSPKLAGSLTPLGQFRTQIHPVHQGLTHGAPVQRGALVAVLAEASTLAGWQALDRAPPLLRAWFAAAHADDPWRWMRAARVC
ncbi:MAG: hypothetical protein M3460_12710 [Actinomycetota bacterium]|nr:hypothetical protein [Actinomycetota bacterium]